MQGKNTVLFDLDGTLTDSAPGILSSLRYALEQMGEPIPDEETLGRFIGPPMRDALEEILHFPPERCAQGVKLYRERYSETGLFENRVYPGIPELLRMLQENGMRLCVATSKPEAYTVRILERFGLDRYFDAVAGSSLDGSRERKADVIRYLLATHGVRSEEAVMVGDRAYDVLGAKENGIPTLGVLFGYGSEKELLDAGAWKVARDTEEAGRILLAAR